MNLKNLHCIDLDQPTFEGFRKFISAWLYKSTSLTFLVDPGPVSTIPRLVEELRRRSVSRLDYILLTHIHIDHAGGAGELLKTYPDARVICHPEGIRHLIEPEKLWKGTLKILGNLAEVYGPIIPVPAASIGFEENVSDSGIRCFLTPGHAQHHLCFLFDDLLFGGEVSGVRNDEVDGIYMRPATPPRFILQVALDSIDRMIALQPRYLVIAHYGLAEPAITYLNIARGQLLLWVEGIAATASVAAEERENAFFAWLLERDEVFRNFDRLPKDIQCRERYFFGNTMRGMIEFVESLQDRK